MWGIVRVYWQSLSLTTKHHLMVSWTRHAERVHLEFPLGHFFRFRSEKSHLHPSSVQPPVHKHVRTACLDEVPILATISFPWSCSWPIYICISVFIYSYVYMHKFKQNQRIWIAVRLGQKLLRLTSKLQEEIEKWLSICQSLSPDLPLAHTSY